jgi:hypothetical protein
MPQQRLILIYKKTPEHQIPFPPMDRQVAQPLKRALEAAIGGEIVRVDEVDLPDPHPEGAPRED